MTPRIWIALDHPDAAAARACAAALEGTAAGLKVGSGLFTRGGPALVAAWVGAGRAIFLDLKFHDTPAQVAGAVAAAADLGVDLVTLHAAGGPAMLAAARAAADRAEKPPALVAVTVLTSLDAGDHARVAGPGARSLPDAALALARLAIEAGIDGCVTSAHEAAALRAALGPAARLVVPGIRPAWSESDHSGQARVATPAAARDAGATDLVLGRAVTAADDPRAALARVEAEL